MVSGEILDAAEEVMHEKGPKEALEYLEQLAGRKVPEGMCVCQAKAGHLIILGTPCKDRVDLIEFYGRLGGGGSNCSYEELKATCSGNYARSEGNEAGKKV
jgi:hypothetical protein